MPFQDYWFVSATQVPLSNTEMLSVGLVLILLAVLFYLYRLLFKLQHDTHIPGIPVVGKAGTIDFRDAMREGNEKYSDQPFLIPFRDPTVIIPPYCIEALKNLPDSQISPNGSQYDRFAVRWTQSGWVDKELAHSIKYDLARELGSLLPSIQEEIQASTSQSLPAQADWSLVQIQPAIVNIVGSVFGRIIVGNRAYRNGYWLPSSIGHALTVILYSGKLRMIPRVLQSVFAHILPEKWELEKTNKGISDTIRPLIDLHLSMSAATAAMDNIGREKKPFASDDGRLVQWLLRRYKPQSNPKFDPSLLIRDHYSLCFAAIHGPTFLLIQMIIDLASFPEHVGPLRKEIDSVLGETPQDKIDASVVSSLELVDAFCKESARMNPQGIIAWLRKTHQPITLTTGHIIPPNVLIGACNPLFHPAATPEITSPEIFDPYRWIKLRAASHNDPAYSFGAAKTDSLIFGYGKHACPGRPFGIPQVKLIFSEIVRGWDVRFPHGATERPKNIYHDFMVFPPIPPIGNLGIEFRKRPGWPGSKD